LALSDVALVEMRVRDVGFTNPPLTGLNGRFHGYGAAGSHPGPLSFFGLAPLYRLFGSTGWALLVSTAALSLVASALAIWIGLRRGGWRFALAVAAVLVFLARAYGIERLANAWNPHLPVLWWLVFLLAVWSVLCDDFPLFPVAVLAGSYATQTHFPYGGPVGAAGALAVAYMGYKLYRAWREPDDRREILRWLAIGGGLGAGLWLLPLLQQVSNEPGNLSIIAETFRRPVDEQVPFGDAWRAWLGHLNVDEMLSGDLDSDLKRGPSLASLALLAAWVTSAVMAWRRRASALIRLHLLVAVAFFAGLVAISRILGTLFPYLMLWAWGTTALMILAVVWTVLSLPSRDAADETAVSSLRVPDLQWERVSTGVLGAAALLFSALFTFDAASAEMDRDDLTQDLDELAAATEHRLAGDPAGCGDDCRYIVTFADPVSLGSPAFGLMVELERQGIDVGAASHQEVGVRSHRVMEPAEADAVIHLARSEPAIERAREVPGSEEIAYVDRYTAAERAAQEPRTAELVDRLEEEGFGAQAARARDEGATGGHLSLDADTSVDLVEEVAWYNALTRPSAVFLIPSENGP
jgi:hypothetical protein